MKNSNKKVLVVSGLILVLIELLYLIPTVSIPDRFLFWLVIPLMFIFFIALVSYINLQEEKVSMFIDPTLERKYTDITNSLQNYLFKKDLEYKQIKITNKYYDALYIELREYASYTLYVRVILEGEYKKNKYSYAHCEVVHIDFKDHEHLYENYKKIVDLDEIYKKIPDY